MSVQVISVVGKQGEREVFKHQFRIPIPSLIPPLPSLPSIEIPKLPELPSFEFPEGLPIPKLPTFNLIPPLPSLPSIELPKLPELPIPEIPAFPQVGAILVEITIESRIE